MRNLIRIAAIVLVALASSTPSLAETLPGWVVHTTPHSYQGLVERLNTAVKANKMGLVTRASATVGAKKKLNKDIAGNMVIGVYRPDFAVRMLEASVTAGIEAPIRFYITENADGSSNLSYKKPSSVFAPYSDGGKALSDLAAELDVIFGQIARDAIAP